jgi:uncharacterized membrane protein HdeD (DUF308 family)
VAIDVEPEIQRLRVARALALLRAVLALLFGLPALAWPFMLPFAMRFLFTVYALTDGVAALAGARAAVDRGRLWLGLQGVTAILAALVAWLGVPLGEEPIRRVLAAWAFADGLLRAGAHAGSSRALALLQAVGSVAFGLFLLSGPGTHRTGWIVATGAYGVCLGVITAAGGYLARPAAARVASPSP